MGMIQYGHEGYVLSVLYSESGIEHQRKIQSKIQVTFLRYSSIRAFSSYSNQIGGQIVKPINGIIHEETQV